MRYGPQGAADNRIAAVDGVRRPVSAGQKTQEAVTIWTGVVDSRPLSMERITMSYYATFDATITLSRDLDMDAIMEEAKRAFCVPEAGIGIVTDKTYDLWFGEYTDYTDDAAWAFLAEIAPYTVDGEIDYAGDDNTYWRHRFDQEKGEWVEEEGYIAYEDGGKSIQELLSFRNEPEKDSQDEPER